MVYRNKNVSLLEFRLLLFLFFVPVLVESLLFRRQRSRVLKHTLFVHLSSFIMVTIALYVRENEQIFFGLFFAGFLIILLSYFILESVSATTVIMKLFTGSIAFWVVVSYFPLNPFLSVVFGAIAFFLSYIFFEIPGKIIEPSPALMQKTKEPERAVLPGKEDKELIPLDIPSLRRAFKAMTTELHQLITDMKPAPFSEYSRFQDIFENIQSLYSEKADAYQQCISQPELERFHTLIDQGKALLSAMKNAEKDWDALRTELNHLKVNAADVTPDQIARIYDQVLIFWSNYEQMIPHHYSVTIQKELTEIEDTVLQHEKMREEWDDLEGAVNTLMKIPFADRTEYELIKERFNAIAESFERYIPGEKIEEIQQKIAFCESRITLMEEWNTLVKTLDAAAKGNLEEIATLKKEFLSNIEKFASVIPPEEISWVKKRLNMYLGER